jgi:GNAT superfamily N-acetyltransferase
MSIRRCVDGDWNDIRRLHIQLALGFPLVVDVDLNQVFATPDSYWVQFVHKCSRDEDQALFVAEVESTCRAMSHIALEGTQARLGMLYVDGGVRRQGLGTALVEAQERWARASGATTLIGHVADTSAGTGLVGRLGWHRTEEISYTRHGLKEHKWEWEGQPGSG